MKVEIVKNFRQFLNGVTTVSSEQLAEFKKKLKSPGSRQGGARTGSAGEETATLQVVVVEEIMCVI